MKCIFRLIEKRGEFSVLEDEKGKKIQWPSNKLPNNISVNQKIFFNISKSDFNSQNAKNILNEIFQTSE